VRRLASRLRQHSSWRAGRGSGSWRARGGSIVAGEKVKAGRWRAGRDNAAITLRQRVGEQAGVAQQLASR